MSCMVEKMYTDPGWNEKARSTRATEQKKGGSKVRINWKKYQSHLLSIFGVETSTFEQPFQSVAGGIGSSDKNVVGGMRKAINIIFGCFELEHVSFRRGDVSAEEL